MKRCYQKTDTHFVQILTIAIDASREVIMPYLNSTEGIKQWFPQLSFNINAPKKRTLMFKMDDTTIQMPILDETSNCIAFSWGEGTVTLHVSSSDHGAELQLTEVMPLTYNMLSKDFTGWLCQMDNIKHIAETKSPLPLDMQKFYKEQAILEDVLKNFEI